MGELVFAASTDIEKTLLRKSSCPPRLHGHGGQSAGQATRVSLNVYGIKIGVEYGHGTERRRKPECSLSVLPGETGDRSDIWRGAVSRGAREAWARRAAGVDQRVKHGEIRSFHELIEAYGPLVTAKATETADGIVIDLFDVPADLFP